MKRRIIHAQNVSVARGGGIYMRFHDGRGVFAVARMTCAEATTLADELLRRIEAERGGEPGGRA